MTDKRIARLVRERGITLLFHFTPMTNLQCILTHGLLSAEELNERKLPYIYIDGWRSGLSGRLRSVDSFGSRLKPRLRKFDVIDNWPQASFGC